MRKKKRKSPQPPEIEVVKLEELDEHEYVTIQVVSKMLGKDPSTVNRWCHSGKLEAVRVQFPMGTETGKEWRIKRLSALKLCPRPPEAPSAGGAPAGLVPAPSGVRGGSAPAVTDREGNFPASEPGEYIPPAEAERLLKLEKYRAERRKNELAERALIEYEEYRDNIATIFSDTWEFFREFIDKWIIRLNLDGEPAKALRDDFEGTLKKYLERQRARALNVSTTGAGGRARSHG